MPAYEIELMPGQDVKMGDTRTDLLYQIREYEGAGYVKDKRFSRIIRTNLSQEDASQMVQRLQSPQ